MSNQIKPKKMKESCEICNAFMKIEDEYKSLRLIISHVDKKITLEMFNDPVDVNICYEKIVRHCVRNFDLKTTFSKKELMEMYRESVKNDPSIKNLKFERLVFPVSNGETCISCPSKALNSCSYQCAFCPSSKGKDDTLTIAKSYNEGQTVFVHLLENKNHFVKYLLQHLIRQYVNGTPIDKLAMRHLGGTFHCYEAPYRYEYSRDIFYCANVVRYIIESPELLSVAKKSIRGEFDPEGIILSSIRKPYLSDEKEDTQIEDHVPSSLKKSLKMEQEENVNALHRVVSYSIETRPDQISPRIMEELLQLGVTIVELGLQSPNNEILSIVKRGHTREVSIRAIKMLKDNGFHVHGQWMLDLPGSTKETDKEAVKDMLSIPFRCDQIKIYPHLSMPGTETKEWLDSGLYTSWVENDWDGFIDVITDLVSGVDETTRIVRIQRDLPQKSEKHPYGYTNNQPSDLERVVTQEIFKRGLERRDIRFHEPGIRFLDLSRLKYSVKMTERDGGRDYFISAFSGAEQSDFRVIWGYCRVSICDKGRQIGFLKGNKYGMIRELKVNGAVSPVGLGGKDAGQHRGIGGKMLEMAEEIVRSEGYSYATVTSAVGVRGYYEKKGYVLDKCGLMWKKLVEDKDVKDVKDVKKETDEEGKIDTYMYDYYLFIMMLLLIVVHIILSLFGVEFYV